MLFMSKISFKGWFQSLANSQISIFEEETFIYVQGTNKKGIH